jgi:hypothetical protein
MGYLTICKSNYSAKFAVPGSGSPRNAPGLAKSNFILFRTTLPLPTRAQALSAGGATAVRFWTVSRESAGGCRGIYLAACELFRCYVIMAWKLLKVFHEMGINEKKLRKDSDRGR